MFFVSLLFILFSHHGCINFIIVVFLFGIQSLFASIAPFIRFFLEIISCYFKILILFIILILIFNCPCLHSLSTLFFLFIRWHQRRIIVKLFFILLVVILVMLKKFKHTSAYDLIQNIFVQDIVKLNCSFSQ